MGDKKSPAHVCRLPLVLKDNAFETPNETWLTQSVTLAGDCLKSLRRRKKTEKCIKSPPIWRHESKSVGVAWVSCRVNGNAIEATTSRSPPETELSGINATRWLLAFGQLWLDFFQPFFFQYFLYNFLSFFFFFFALFKVWSGKKYGEHLDSCVEEFLALVRVLIKYSWKLSSEKEWLQYVQTWQMFIQNL